VTYSGPNVKAQGGGPVGYDQEVARKKEGLVASARVLGKREAMDRGHGVIGQEDEQLHLSAPKRSIESTAGYTYQARMAPTKD
jgi:hypothetical protein